MQAKLCTLLLALIVAPSALAQKYSVRNLGTLGKHVVPTSINNKGDVVGYYYLDKRVIHAFLWTRSAGMKDLGTLGGEMSVAGSINDDGLIVGYAQTPTRMTAFSWTAATGMVDLDPTRSADSFAYDVNQNGAIVGTSGTGVIWRENGFITDLGPLSPLAINNREEVTGIGSSSGGFFWSQSSGTLDLGTLGGTYSQGSAINDLAQVTGWSAIAGTNREHAFLWTQDGGMKDLGTLGGAWSRANAINKKGQIVGFSATPTNDSGVAFLWTKWSGQRDLNKLIPSAPEWRLFIGQAINDAGQIAVRAYRGDNIWWRAVILTPIMATTVTSSSNPAPPGAAITFTAKVSNSIQGVPPNDATVTFKDGTKTLAIVPLRSGTAAFTTSLLSSGTHNITANYSGNLNYDPSKSAVLPQVVSAP